MNCQVKQEIVTDSESSGSDSSEDEDEVVKEKKEEEAEKELAPKTKNELGLSDLPAVEDMNLKVHIAAIATISPILRFR